MSHPRSVDQAIARFDEVMGRIDRARRRARRAAARAVARSPRRSARKLANIGIALAAADRRDHRASA